MPARLARRIERQKGRVGVAEMQSAGRTGRKARDEFHRAPFSVSYGFFGAGGGVCTVLALSALMKSAGVISPFSMAWPVAARASGFSGLAVNFTLPPLSRKAPKG